LVIGRRSLVVRRWRKTGLTNDERPMTND